MSDILLSELPPADVAWLHEVGDERRLAKGDVLIDPRRRLDCLYVLLSGELSVLQPDSFLAGAAAHEIARLETGELLGESWLFGIEPVAAVTATAASRVLAISRQRLADRLGGDPGFSAHFYRVLAMLTSERLRRIFEDPQAVCYGSSQTVKEALAVFGELRDTDMAWMLSVGTVEKLDAGQVLLSSGQPVDMFYMVLDGQLAIAATPTQVLAYISRGGLPGIISFIDFQPLPVTIRAVKTARVFAIPRPNILIQLQEDQVFAARFYRLVATQLASLLRAVVAGLGSGQEELEGELDLESLQQLCHSGTKFDWMLRQLGVGCG